MDDIVINIDKDGIVQTPNILKSDANLGLKQLGVWTTSSLTTQQTQVLLRRESESPRSHFQAEQMTVLEVVQLRPAYILTDKAQVVQASDSEVFEPSQDQVPQGGGVEFHPPSILLKIGR